jgi:hypothetical protein
MEESVTPSAVTVVMRTIRRCLGAAFVVALAVVSAHAADPSTWPEMRLDPDWERRTDGRRSRSPDDPPNVSHNPPAPMAADEHARRLADFHFVNLHWENSEPLRLGGDWFIVQRRRALFLWRIGDETQHRLFHFPKLHAPHEAALFPLSVPFGGGTFIVAGDPRQSRDSRKLVWWSQAETAFVADLDLPFGLYVKHIVPLDATWVLVCGVPGGSLDMKERGQTREALVVQLKDRRLTRVDSHPVALRMVLDAAGVNGPVAGVGWIAPGKLAFETADSPAWKAAQASQVAHRSELRAYGEPGPGRRAYQANDTPEMRQLLQDLKIRYAQDSGTAPKAGPLTYDTAHCAWSPNELPPVMRGSRDVEVTPHWLPDGRVVIRWATWGKDSKGDQQLLTPLIWNAESRRWDELERPAAPLAPESALFNLWPGDPLVNGIQRQGAIEVLNPQTLRWSPRLTPTFSWNVHQSGDEMRFSVLSDGSLLFGGPKGMGVWRVTEGQSRYAEPPETHLLPYRFDAAAGRSDGGMLLVGWPRKPTVVATWQQDFPEVRAQWFAPGATSPNILPLPPYLLTKPEVLALTDGSFLLFAGQPEACATQACTGASAVPALRLHPEEGRWEVLTQLAVPALGVTGNSQQQLRADSGAIVRTNGDVVWMINEGTPPAPVRTTLYRWRPGLDAPELVARLTRGRAEVKLSEAPDGEGRPRRLTAMGGQAQLELIAEEKTCFECPEVLFSIGSLVPARSSEYLDESGSAPQWLSGPRSPPKDTSFPPLRLSNGHVFRLLSTTPTIQAEVADVGLEGWTPLPPLPLDSISCRGPRVRCVPATLNDLAGDRIRVTSAQVVGNRVFLLPDPRLENKTWGPDWSSERYLTAIFVWDDDRREWSTEYRRASTGEPRAAVGLPDGSVRMLYPRAFETLTWPEPATRTQTQTARAADTAGNR